MHWENVSWLLAIYGACVIVLQLVLLINWGRVRNAFAMACNGTVRTYPNDVWVPITESAVRRIVREELCNNHQTKPAPPGEGEG